MPYPRGAAWSHARRGGTLLICVALSTGVPTSAQDEPARSFVPIPTLSVKAAEKHLLGLGFTCRPEEDEPPPPPDQAINCGLGQGGGQSYFARLVHDPDGHLLWLTVQSRRAEDGSYSVEEALALLTSVASLKYDGSDPGLVADWLHQNLAVPLSEMVDPGSQMYNPRTGLPELAPPLQIGGVVFTIVGMPSSPGFDLALRGY
jgi:hypothetical protein